GDHAGAERDAGVALPDPERRGAELVRRGVVDQLGQAGAAAPEKAPLPAVERALPADEVQQRLAGGRVEGGVVQDAELAPAAVLSARGRIARGAGRRGRAG